MPLGPFSTISLTHVALTSPYTDKHEMYASRAISLNVANTHLTARKTVLLQIQQCSKLKPLVSFSTPGPPELFLDMSTGSHPVPGPETISPPQQIEVQVLFSTSTALLVLTLIFSHTDGTLSPTDQTSLSIYSTEGSLPSSQIALSKPYTDSPSQQVQVQVPQNSLRRIWSASSQC